MLRSCLTTPRDRGTAKSLNVSGDGSGVGLPLKGEPMIETRAGFLALMLAISLLCATHAGADASASGSTGSNASTLADDEVVNERIQSAGRGAHLGRELCGFTSAGVTRYKESLRRSLGSPANFDAAWDYGWGRATPVLLQFQSLRASDPQDYESRVHLICATLRRTGERVEKSSGSEPSPQH